MVTHAGPFPAGPPAAATLAASENGHYVGYALNDLANAVKSVLIPGEGLSVKVIQEGKEPGQGVGYLDDGTMVVIEDGRRLINQQVDVTVTKVLQTAAGRMIFARPDRSA